MKILNKYKSVSNRSSGGGNRGKMKKKEGREAAGGRANKTKKKIRATFFFFLYETCRLRYHGVDCNDSFKNFVFGTTY